MKKVIRSRVVMCGKCKEGEIRSTHKFDGETNEVLIRKCSNPNCKYQYGLKEMLDSNLKRMYTVMQ